MNKKIIISLIAICFIGLIFGFFYIWSQNKELVSEPPSLPTPAENFISGTIKAVIENKLILETEDKEVKIIQTNENTQILKKEEEQGSLKDLQEDQQIICVISEENIAKTIYIFY